MGEGGRTARVAEVARSPRGEHLSPRAAARCLQLLALLDLRGRRGQRDPQVTSVTQPGLRMTGLFLPSVYNRKNEKTGDMASWIAQGPRILEKPGPEGQRFLDSRAFGST
jgi:hypothetical protein